MKGFTGFAVIILVFLSIMTQTEAGQLKNKLIMHTLECIPDYELTMEDLEKLLRKDLENPSKSLQCLTRCTLHKANILVNGVLNEKLLIEWLLKDYAKDYVDKIIAACPYENGKKDCASIYNAGSCYAKLMIND